MSFQRLGEEMYECGTFVNNNREEFREKVQLMITDCGISFSTKKSMIKENERFG